MTFALEAQQYAVTPARDGAGALAALRDGAFDLVITDYDMPGLTGASDDEVVRDLLTMCGVPRRD